MICLIHVLLSTLCLLACYMLKVVVDVSLRGFIFWYVCAISRGYSLTSHLTNIKLFIFLFEN